MLTPISHGLCPTSSWAHLGLICLAGGRPRKQSRNANIHEFSNNSFSSTSTSWVHHRSFSRAWRFLHTGLDRLSSLNVSMNRRGWRTALPAGIPRLQPSTETLSPLSCAPCSNGFAACSSSGPRTPRTALFILSCFASLPSCFLEIPHRC
ncbi:uncharacterized protein B0I36DRAFT_62746 [Microdochium trichocladiopsis]|uniref:Uncharacterized protein n=1 Tax=Microdochium trichocladiopsis TaxID=1682393 RepID=A0A9P8YFX3_9PEZI|nr:uncharacterized protein B0I36DRAFT_62746 [Microdochium trichocladiopsis]KAH7037193.1 hypothetical protein B0I36DRAFT_62746 [Microdochium trichocladiopsis]